jgi:2-polyprenyl-3-methyl-5-hydroxy-6-metoxy-1,4-benzoquinol methylase
LRLSETRLCDARNAVFELLDIRRLGQRKDLFESFAVAICLETVEHILDDRKLLRDMSRYWFSADLCC